MIRHVFVVFGLYSTIPCERDRLDVPNFDVGAAVRDAAAAEDTAATECTGWCNRNPDTCLMDTTGRNLAKGLWTHFLKDVLTVVEDTWCPAWCKNTPSCRDKCLGALSQNGERNDWCKMAYICSGNVREKEPRCANWEVNQPTTIAMTTATTTTTTTPLQMVDTYIVGGAGGWGGACMCPSGGIYYVGDNNNGCGSIACTNGKQLSCFNSVGKGSQNQVECSVPPKTVDSFQKDAPGAGGWGGACMCPSGGIYFVGDNGDACGSLACTNGGEKLWCEKGTGHWSRNKVDCGGGDKPIVYEMPPNKPFSVWGIDERYKTTSNKVEFGVKTGGWGGECICPNGDSYAVGDNNDACGTLACDGGLKVNCNKQVGPWSFRKVTCQGSSTFNKYFNWEDIKTNIIWSGPSGPSECKAGCENTDKCKAWEVCPVGPGCNGCYLIGEVSNLQIRPTEKGWFAGLKGDPMFN